MIDLYNNNVYLNILQTLNEKLNEVESFLKKIEQSNDFQSIDNLVSIYKLIFDNNELNQFIKFRIEKIFKSLYLRNPPEYNKGNSYYFLELKINNSEIILLDNIYSNKLSGILKLYKHSFSKIDDYYSSLDKEQIIRFSFLFQDIKKDISNFISSNENRDIIDKKRKLDEVYLKKMPYGGLYYMVDISHVKSILDNGILSHNTAHNLGLVKEDISNKQVNERRNRLEPIYSHNIHDYAPLYINPKNPMLYVLCKNGHKENTVLMRINPHILMLNNILFSDGNAAAKSTNFYKNISDFNKLNWTCINDEYWTNYQDGKRFRCSEVLIYEKILTYYIDEIITQNERILNTILPLFPNHLGIKVNVNAKMYF